jgi:subtilisin family serine protease
LICDVVPLTGWWQRLPRDPQNFQSVFGRSDSAIGADELLSAALRRVSNIEFFRYAVLAGFIYCLMNVKSAADYGALKQVAKRLGPLSGDDATVERGPTARRRDSEPRLSHIRPIIKGYEELVGRKAGGRDLAMAEESRPGADDTKGIFLINVNRPPTQTLFESRNTVKGDAAQRVFDISTDGIAFAVIDGGIDATHPGFVKRNDPGPSAANSCVAATYDFTILRDIIASGGDAQFAPDANKAAIPRIATNADFKTALEHLKIRNQNARDLDWEIARPLIEIKHDDAYAIPGSDHGTHVAGILAANLPKSDVPHPILGMCPGLLLYDLRVFDHDGVGDEFTILCACREHQWQAP